MVPDPMKLRLDDLTVDRDRRALRRGEEDVHVSPRAYRLLELLLDRRPKAVPQQEILDALWPDTVVSDGSIKVLVNELRRALRDDARKPRWIRTVPAWGYALEGPVREEEGPATAARHSVVWAGSVVPLSEGVNVLGRDRDVAVLVGHPSVSRRHAQVRVDGRSAVLEDLGSHNGTWVGSKRVDAPVPLFDGDQILLGTATLTYRGPAAGPSLATRSVP